MFEPPLVKKIRSSIFLKILVVFILGIIVFSISMKLTHDQLFKKPRFPKIQRMAVINTLSLVEKLQSPLDEQEVRALSDSLEIDFRFQNAQCAWATAQGLPEFDEVDLPPYPPEPSICAGLNRGLLVVLPVDEGMLMVVLQQHSEGFLRKAQLYSLVNLAILAAIIFSIYLSIRHILKPIRQLDAGVQQLSKGNLDFYMVSRRADEMGKLIRSFSAMAVHIKEMVAARDRLLLDVSHELRSPLTRVKLSLEMMRTCAEQSEIREDIHEMEVMITELLETERLKSTHGALEMERFDLGLLLDDLGETFEGQAPGIEIDNEAEVAVLADWNRLRTLLGNLLANALKYTELPDVPVRLAVIPCHKTVKVIIENRGPEISEADLPFVFEPFFRVDKSRNKNTGGYGLGLSLSRRIAEAHGGQLYLENVSGLGVRAVLVLPVALEAGE